MSFDKLAGIYVYCMDYHNGQWSRLYRLMSRIGLRLKLTDSAIKGIQTGSEEWFEAHTVYNSLCNSQRFLNGR